MESYQQPFVDNILYLIYLNSKMYISKKHENAIKIIIKTGIRIQHGNYLEALMLKIIS